MIRRYKGFINGAKHSVGTAFGIFCGFLQSHNSLALLAEVATQNYQKNGENDKESGRNPDTFNELLLPVALNRQGENIPRRHWNAVTIENVVCFFLS